MSNRAVDDLNGDPDPRHVLTVDARVAGTPDPNQATVAHVGPEPTAERPPTRLGDYDLLGEIARGGMGIVFKARHRKWNRIVALKVTRAGQLASESEARRFQAEVEAAGQLDHPNIVPIYEAGEADGSLYFAMAHVEGPSLAQRIADRPLAPGEAAALIRQAAAAVAYAHGHGVIHRDLKPGNILLDEAGTPRITDFGLAKRTDSDSSLTQAGQVVGTPSFMSPEQAEGKNEQVGPLSDVYSLGATLYCLLTGRPPFQAASVVDTLKQVVEREPVAPRTLNPAVDRDLDTICLKCLQKQPERRYASAAALGDDLQRFLDRRPIAARPVGSVEKAMRWCRRNPVVAASLAGVAAIFLMAFALVSWSYVRAEGALVEEATQRQAADEARQQAQREQAAERWERYRSNLITVGSAMRLHNVAAARDALDAAPPEHRGWEWRYYYPRLDVAQMSLSTGGIAADVHSPYASQVVAFRSANNVTRLWDFKTRQEKTGIPYLTAAKYREPSPDGGLLAITVHDHHTIHLWDLAAGRERVILRGHETEVGQPGFSPDATLVAASARDFSIRVWDAATGDEKLVLRGHQDVATETDFSPDGRRLLTGGNDDRTARIWDLSTGQTLHRLAGHEGSVGRVRFNPQGDRAVTVEAFPSNSLRLWDAGTGQLLNVLRGHSGEIRSLNFSPDGRRLATGSFDQTIRLWDGRTGAPVATLTGHAGWVQQVNFSPDSTRLVSASQDQTVRLWDVATGAPVSILHGHVANVEWAGFSSDGATVTSLSTDGNLRWWDVRLAEQNGILRGHDGFVYGVAFHPDGERVASASWDGTVRIWDATTGRQRAELKYPEKTVVTSVSFHPGGKLLASLGRDDAVRIWDVDSGVEVRRLAVPTKKWQDTRVTFSPRGDRLACGGTDNAIHVWDVATWAEVAVLTGQHDFIRDVAFDRHGNWLAAAGEVSDLNIRIWDLTKRENVKVLAGHVDTVYSLAVSHDGKWLASGSFDGTVRLWDTATWNEVAVLHHGSNVYGLAFSPDGARLACGCANNTIRLWDLATHKTVAELHGHGSYVHQVAFSPDGTRLVSGSGDFTVRIWDTLSVPERGRKSGAGAMAWPKDWSGQVGQRVTLEGTAANAKQGALLLHGKDNEIWIEGLDSWPEGFYAGGDQGRRLRVTGTVIRKDDVPVFLQKPGAPPRAGIPVKSEEELEKAKWRYLLQDAKWKVLPY